MPGRPKELGMGAIEKRQNKPNLLQVLIVTRLLLKTNQGGIGPENKPNLRPAARGNSGEWRESSGQSPVVMNQRTCDQERENASRPQWSEKPKERAGGARKAQNEPNCNRSLITDSQELKVESCVIVDAKQTQFRGLDGETMNAGNAPRLTLHAQSGQRSERSELAVREKR